MPAENEQVVIEPGTYTLTKAITPGAPGMDVRGATGGPRPLIIAQATEAFAGVARFTLDYLAIEEQGTEAALGLGGATLVRLSIRGTPSSLGDVLCQCYNGSIIDSVLVALPGSSNGAVGVVSNGGTSTETLRNDTIYSESASAPAISLSQIAASGELTLSAYNTIAVNAAGGHDVRASAHAKIVMNHSDYASPAAEGGTITAGGGMNS